MYVMWGQMRLTRLGVFRVKPWSEVKIDFGLG